MENLKMPRWPDEANQVLAADGLLDGLPAPAWSSGLDFLLGGADGQRDALTIGQVDPGRLVLGRPEGIYLSASGQKILSGRSLSIGNRKEFLAGEQ